MKLLAALAAAVLVLSFSAPAAADPEALIAKEKCSRCHTDKTTKKGPSYADVAAKYKGKPDPTSMLVEMLKTGGKEDHKTVKAGDDELKAVVAFILAK